MNMKRIIRERILTAEEAAEDQKIRDQVAAELPGLIARHHAGLAEPAQIEATHEDRRSIPSVSVTYARNGSSTRANPPAMRPMQERASQNRGEQYLLIKSPP